MLKRTAALVLAFIALCGQTAAFSDQSFYSLGFYEKSALQTAGRASRASHEHMYELFYDAAGHWYICTACGVETEKEEHYAACTAPDVCVLCGALKEEGAVMDEPEHDWQLQMDAAYHWDECARCGAVAARETHYAICAGKDPNLCAICGATAEDKAEIGPVVHLYLDTMLFDNSSHWYLCVLCGQKNSQEAHAFRNGKCTACGYETIAAPTATPAPIPTPTKTPEPSQTPESGSCQGGKQHTGPYSYRNRVSPTCTEAGRWEKYCDACGRFVATETISPSHRFVNVTEVITAPTCLTAGTQRTSSVCEVCGYCGGTADQSLPALGHDWGEAAYTWSPNHRTATASRVCKRDGGHVESEQVSASAQILSPTDKTAGHAAFTAQDFQNAAFKKQTATVFLPALNTLNVLRLPARTVSVEGEAFVHLTCEAVIIPDGCVSIGSRAFADCKNLLYVRIPASVTYIAEDAFAGCEQAVIDRLTE